MIEAREAGDSEREPTSILVHALSESIVCRPLGGLEISLNIVTWGCARKASLHPRLYAVARFAGWNTSKTPLPRVALAKPRSTLGFMLAPASWGGNSRGSNLTFIEFNFVGFQKSNELVPKRNALMVLLLSRDVPLNLLQI